MFRRPLSALAIAVAVSCGDLTPAAARRRLGTFPVLFEGDPAAGGGGGGGSGTKTYTQAELDAELSGLRTKNTQLIGEQKKLQERYKPFEGLEADPDTIRAALTEREKAEEARKRKEGEFETWRTEIRSAHQKELEKHTGEITRVKSALERHLVDGALVAAIAGAKGEPEVLLPAMRSQVRMVEVDGGEFLARVVDAKGTPRMKGADGFMAIDDLVAEFKAKPKWGVAFAAPDAAGGGAGGSGGGGGGGSSSGDVLYISPEDARDTRKFRLADAKAQKEGKRLEIGPSK